MQLIRRFLGQSFGDTTTPCSQEGMIVTPEQRAPVVNAIRAALNAAGLQDVGIMADESSSTGYFIPEAPVWLPEAKDSLAAVVRIRTASGHQAPTPATRVRNRAPSPGAV